jgi:hypothetical protein
VARDTDVAITTDPHGGGVLVRCGRAEWHMPALPVAEYPTLPYSATRSAPSTPDSCVARWAGSCPPWT